MDGNQNFVRFEIEEALFEKVIRGEKAAVEEYNDVLEDTSYPQAHYRFKKNQKLVIENGLTKIITLEDV